MDGLSKTRSGARFGVFLFLATAACTGGGDGTGAPAASGDAGSDASATPPIDAGAADPPPLSDNVYATSCTADSDCVAVSEPACANARCACASRAISNSDAMRYQTDLSAYQATCEALHPSPPCGIDCVATKALCCTNTCTLKTAGTTCN